MCLPYESGNRVLFYHKGSDTWTISNLSSISTEGKEGKVHLTGGCYIDLSGKFCASDISEKQTKVARLQIIYLKEDASQHESRDMDNCFFFLFIQLKITKNMVHFMGHRVKILCFLNYINFKFCPFKKICTHQPVFGGWGDWLLQGSLSVLYLGNSHVSEV